MSGVYAGFSVGEHLRAGPAAARVERTAAGVPGARGDAALFVRAIIYED